MKQASMWRRGLEYVLCLFNCVVHDYWRSRDSSYPQNNSFFLFFSRVPFWYVCMIPVGDWNICVSLPGNARERAGNKQFAWRNIPFQQVLCVCVCACVCVRARPRMCVRACSSERDSCVNTAQQQNTIFCKTSSSKLRWSHGALCFGKYVSQGLIYFSSLWSQGRNFALAWADVDVAFYSNTHYLWVRKTDAQLDKWWAFFFF